MPNVALVVLDTLRSDAFERHFDWLPGRYFTDVWSTSHWTIPAHGSLFTGKYPSEHGSHARAKALDDGDDVLAELLSAAGYRTRAFSSNLNVAPQFGFDRGFDHFEGGPRIGPNLLDGVFDWDGLRRESTSPLGVDLVRAAGRSVAGPYDTLPSLKYVLEAELQRREWYDRHDPRVDLTPWEYPDQTGILQATARVSEMEFEDSGEFLYCNLMEAHAPYTWIPDRHVRNPEFYGSGHLGVREMIEGQERPELVREDYDDAVAFQSSVYRGLFAELREAMDVVVTISDHGQLLGEYGGWGHEYGLYPELTRIPVVVWTGEADRTRDDTLASIRDVFQTVLDYAGVEGPDRGQSLRDTTDFDERDLVVESFGIPTGMREAYEDEGLPYEPYDGRFRGVYVAGEGYAHETKDGWTSDAVSAETAEAAFENRVADIDPSGVPDSIEVDELTRQRLEDLGYR